MHALFSIWDLYGSIKQIRQYHQPFGYVALNLEHEKTWLWQQDK